jgi:hypothetical protein
MLIIGAWAFSHKLFTLLLLQLVTFQLIKRNMPSVGLSLVNVEFSMGSEEISEICFRCRKKVSCVLFAKEEISCNPLENACFISFSLTTNVRPALPLSVLAYLLSIVVK